MYEEKKFKSTRRTLKSLHQTHSFVLVGILAFYDEVGTCDEQMSQSKLVQRQELKSGPSIFSPGAFLLYYPIFTLYIVIYNIICPFFWICLNVLLTTYFQTELVQCILVVLFTLKHNPTLLAYIFFFFWNVESYYIVDNLQRMYLWWHNSKFHHAGNDDSCGLNYTHENSSSQPCLKLKTVLPIRHNLKT